MSFGGLKTVLACGGILACGLAARALDAPSVVVTRILATDVTASGQPIVLPQNDVQVVVSTYEFPAGATLPEHKHPFPRYAYVLEGTLEVSYDATGTRTVYKPGDFILEAVEQWHHGAAIGSGPVKLLVIDQVVKGEKNVVLKE